MTVKELIKQLSEYPDDTDVKFTDDYGETTITDVYESHDCVLLI